MALSMVFTLCLTSIAIGSEVAYGIFVSLNVSGLVTSYIICIACESLLYFSLSITLCLPSPLLTVRYTLLSSFLRPPSTLLLLYLITPKSRYPPRPPLPHIPPTAPLPLLPRLQNRHRNQHRGTSLPNRLLDLSVRARGAEPSGQRDELELCDLGLCSWVFYGVLCRQGEIYVYRTEGED